jgi:hypothetical protein
MSAEEISCTRAMRLIFSYLIRLVVSHGIVIQSNPSFLPAPVCATLLVEIPRKDGPLPQRFQILRVRGRKSVRFSPSCIIIAKQRRGGKNF